jgi:hypothetical protein
MSTIVLYLSFLTSSLISLGAIAFQSYIYRRLPTYATPLYLVTEVVNAAIALLLFVLTLGQRLEDEEVIENVVS